MLLAAEFSFVLIVQLLSQNLRGSQTPSWQPPEFSITVQNQLANGAAVVGQGGQVGGSTGELHSEQPISGIVEQLADCRQDLVLLYQLRGSQLQQR